MNRKPVSKKTRFEVFKRDSFSCQYCGKSAPEVILHVDHINPVSKGGKNSMINYVTACQDCNLGKSDRQLSDSSAVMKAKSQADLLQERRSQIEMMANWYQEMQKIECSEVDIIDEKIQSYCNFELNQRGRQQMTKRIKKHGLRNVVEKLEIAFSEHVENSSDFSKRIDKLDKLLRWGDQPFHTQRANYITAVIRNRFPRQYNWFPCFKRIMLFVFESEPSLASGFYNIAANGAEVESIRDEMLEVAENAGVDEEKLIEIWNK